MKNKKIKFMVIAVIGIITLSTLTIKLQKKDKSVINKNNNNSSISSENENSEIESQVILDVPLISQLPELYNGCEITSLTMLLNYKGINVNKLTLADEMIKDNTPLVKDFNNNIYSWGNPENGFVGDVYGDPLPGYAINPKPLTPLIEKYYPKGFLNLTGTSLEEIEVSLSNGNPVIVWVTADLSTPYGFITWLDGNGNKVKATFQTHAVLLIGYDDDNFYYNDPLSELKAATIDKETFEEVWTDMGKKALTVK